MSWGKHKGELLADGSILIYECRFNSIITLMEVINESDDYDMALIGNDYALYNISRDEIYSVEFKKWFKL